MQRQLAPIVEGLIYGPSYAYLNYLIRSPRPLEAEATWQAVAGRRSPLIEWARNEWPPAFCRPWLLARKQRQDARLGIAAHYDVSNEFYELFLDKKYMFYSCADFRSDDDTLEDAQTRKADFLFNLIDPQPGERILELGCGWGSMLKRIYESTGDKDNLYGYTLSREQAAVQPDSRKIQRRGSRIFSRPITARSSSTRSIPSARGSTCGRKKRGPSWRNCSLRSSRVAGW